MVHIKLAAFAFVTMAALSAVTAAAQTLAEPAVAARPIDADAWQQRIAGDIPGHARFEGLAAMRFGLLVTSSGSVRSCMALPVDERQQARGEARGQELCEGFLEHARFEPARDAGGTPVDSVFVAEFASSRPLVAADYAGEPAI